MNFVNIDQLVDRLKSNNLFADLNYESILMWTADFFNILDSPKLYDTYKVPIEIKNYNGKLPSNFIKMISVRKLSNNRDFVDNNTEIKESYLTNTIKEANPNKFISARVSTDSFHPSEKAIDFTYVIRDGMIITSLKEGLIQISYSGMKVDDEGRPMIPENYAIMRALLLYIKMQYYDMLFENMLIPYQLLQKVEQQYSWAIGRASNELHKLSLDDMANFTSIMNRLIVDLTAHERGFINLGVQERIRRQ